MPLNAVSTHVIHSKTHTGAVVDGAAFGFDVRIAMLSYYMQRGSLACRTTKAGSFGNPH